MRLIPAIHLLQRGEFVSDQKSRNPSLKNCGVFPTISARRFQMQGSPTPQLSPLTPLIKGQAVVA